MKTAGRAFESRFRCAFMCAWQIEPFIPHNEQIIAVKEYFVSFAEYNLM
jgi:hypothetical protein